MKETQIRQEIEKALVLGHKVQSLLLQSMRLVSDKSSSLVMNEMENAFRCTETSLASLEDTLGVRGSIKDVIELCDGYIAALKQARREALTYLNDIEAGDINESIYYAEEVMVSLKGIVDGYKSM